jgi:hypothetical protein
MPQQGLIDRHGPAIAAAAATGKPQAGHTFMKSLVLKHGHQFTAIHQKLLTHAATRMEGLDQDWTNSQHSSG